MKNLNLKKKVLVSLILTSGAFLSSCSEHIKKNDYIYSKGKELSDIKFLDNLSKDIKDKKQKIGEDYFYYKLELDKNDLTFLEEKQGNTLINANIDSNVKDALNFVLSFIPNVSISYKINNPDYLLRNIKLRLSNVSPVKALKMIESSGGIDVYYQNNVIYVSDEMRVSGIINKLEDQNSKGSYQKIKTYLENTLAIDKFNVKLYEIVEEISSKDILKSKKESKKKSDKKNVNIVNKEISGVKPEIILDETTGALFIKASPMVLRNNKRLIENFINSSISYATIEFSIYKINNNKAKNLGVSVSKVIDNLYTLSLGTEQSESLLSNVASFNRNVIDKNGDTLKTGVNLYEKTGILQSSSSTILTLFNDQETKLSNLESTGYWTPGNLKQNNTLINGASVITYSEDKPEYKKEKIGNEIKIVPRINIENQKINMSINFKDSKIYGIDSFIWKRNGEEQYSTELKIPLKSENNINAIITLTGDKYSILAGFKNRSISFNKQNIPNTGNIFLLNDIGNHQEEAKEMSTLFIMKANFPKNRVTKFFKKIK